MHMQKYAPRCHDRFVMALTQEKLTNTPQKKAGKKEKQCRN